MTRGPGGRKSVGGREGVSNASIRRATRHTLDPVWFRGLRAVGGGEGGCRYDPTRSVQRHSSFRHLLDKSKPNDEKEKKSTQVLERSCLYDECPVKDEWGHDIKHMIKERNRKQGDPRRFSLKNSGGSSV